MFAKYIIAETSGERLAVSAHSYAEAFSTLTRRGDRAPFVFTAGEARASLASLCAVTGLIGLTPAQTFDATGRAGMPLQAGPGRGSTTR